jgi:hypothetical protein
VAVHPLAYTNYSIPASRAFPGGRIAPRAVLKLKLISAGQQLSCYGIIDSGADHCVFPRSFMQPLGLDPLASPIELTAGLGSVNVPTHFANITLDIQGIIRIPIYAGFTVGLEPWGVGLLGQTGFFDRFNVHFKLAEKNCYIEIP